MIFTPNVEGSDSLMTLIFTFKDGDGDLGLTQSDTFPPYNAVLDPNNNNKSLNPYYNNLYIDYLESIDGIFQYVTAPFTTDTLNYSFRFESLTPTGRHKAIRGDIEVQLSPSPYPDARDTVMYKFFIYDRALHKSNLVETPPLIWKR